MNKKRKPSKNTPTSQSRAEGIIKMIRERQANAVSENQDQLNTPKKIQEMLSRIAGEESEADRTIREFKRWEAEQEDSKECGFHDFSTLDVCGNALGLYNEMISEWEFEKDPKELKNIFKMQLSSILEVCPDHIAQDISLQRKGL